MNAELDSRQLRNLARQTAKAGEAATAAAEQPLKNVLQEVPANFDGKAAEALYESVSELRGEVLKLSRNLYDIQLELNRLADELEAADQQAKDIIISQ